MMSSRRNEMKKNIAILGAGAFGTALAISFSNTHKVSLFSCFEDHVSSLRNKRQNSFLEGFVIPDCVEIQNTCDFQKGKFDYIFWCFPVKPTLEIVNQFDNKLDNSKVIICSKGLYKDGRFLVNVFEDHVTDSEIGYLSGPNFAFEIAKALPSAADITFLKIETAKRAASDLSSKTLKLVPSDDLIGVQIAGAFKNVIAIASGMVMGLALGQNAHATLITKSLIEIQTLGLKLGAREKTFYGLSGLGDLILTTNSDNSRNTMLGKRLAKGESLQNILNSTNAVCEGYETIEQLMTLAKTNSVKLPICQKVYEILSEKRPVADIADVIA